MPFLDMVRSFIAMELVDNLKVSDEAVEEILTKTGFGITVRNTDHS